MITDPQAVVIEEIEIEKPSNNAWFILGAIAVIIAVIFGVRAIRKGSDDVSGAADAPSDATPT